MLTSVDDLPAEVTVEPHQGEFFDDFDGNDFDDDSEFDPR